MIGTPFHFTAREFALHERMCTLLESNFGTLKIQHETSAILGIDCQGRPLQDVLQLLNQRLASVISFSAQTVEDSANYLEITSKLSQIKIETPSAKNSGRRRHRKAAAKSKSVETLPSTEQQKELYYDSLHANLYICQTLCTYLFQALYHHKLDALRISNQGFQHVISYFLLLGCILNYNMLSYQTHPVHKEVNIDRMNGLFSASKNWTILLESFHLNYGQGIDFNELRILFVKRMIAFRQQLLQHPKYVDLLTDDMLFPLSIDELEYHLAQKNERSVRLGLPYYGSTIIPDANMLYNASQGSEKIFFEKLLSTCLDESTSHKRAQFLFFYNEANGNVDVFDVKQNPITNCLEIMNVHTGNSCAHHNLLLRLHSVLSFSNIHFKILACQANLGPRTQSTSLYAFRISALLAKKSFAEITEKCTLQQPDFMDEAHTGPQKLHPIAQVDWFPIETLGDKAVLLIHSLQRRQALLKERFADYQKQYGLSEIVKDDPATLYNYADDYRKRLAYRYHRKNPFANITVNILTTNMAIKEKNDGQLIRRGASNVYKMKTREFEFLVDHLKKDGQAAALHLPAKEKDYTPLHWALKGGSAKKAAILLNATPFTEAELNEPNKDNKSAKDYFAESKNPKVTENPVLQRFLTRLR